MASRNLSPWCWLFDSNEHWRRDGEGRQGMIAEQALGCWLLAAFLQVSLQQID